jgi:hypothetical protein
MDALIASGLSWKPVWDIFSKPDNVPIIMMVGLVGFFTYWAFSMALRNDRLKVESGDPKRDLFYPPEEAKFPVRIHVWPWLLRTELLCFIWMMVIMTVWSLGLDAPLEDPADPSLTPNPSKAPWYFLGLQEMLVYFDPWIAGVIMPTLIVVGLMALPYIDVNPKGNGYYTFKERKFAITTFCFGFHMLWCVLIIIGTVMRGPGWIWFWPGQEWDPHAIVSQSNVDLPEFLFGIPTKTEFGQLTAGHMAVGSVALVLFFAVGMLLPYLYLKRKKSPILEQLGMPRYLLTAFLGVSMLGLVAKIGLRVMFNIKYVLVTPFASF